MNSKTDYFKSKLLSQSLAVRTPVLEEVKRVIDTVSPDYDGVKQYKTCIKEWLKPIIDLSDFYVYPMNGITEGLNWWMHTCNTNIDVLPGDYQWVHSKSGYPNSILYQSVPSAIDGNYITIDENRVTALDLAYVGSTRINPIKINKNVPYVFYSLSKAFGVRNIRTGWYFTREPDEKLENLINSAKYYNYYAHDVSEKIISNFDIDYVYKKISTLQNKICSALSLTPSDSVWLATSNDNLYSKFRRKGTLARLCLSGVYEEC